MQQSSHLKARPTAMDLHIFHLPTEIVLNIFSYVPSKQVLLNVCLVCKHFNEMLRSEWYWRTRYVQSVAAQPAVSGLDLQQWQLGCMQAEFAAMAHRGARNLNMSQLRGATGGLDCVRILHPELHGASALIAAGSRDSNVYVWRRRVGGDEEGSAGGRSMRSFTGAVMSGHRGWVWSLASDLKRPHLLCSGAWDACVQVWDITVSICIANISKCHKAAVLSLDMPEQDTLVSGSYDKNVRLFDLRVPITEVASYKEHSKPVLCVAATDRYVYSGSEDKSLCVWDRRAQSQLQKIKLPSIVAGLHHEAGIVTAAGGSVVKVYKSSEGNLQEQCSLSPKHKHSQSLTSVYHNLGMVVTGSKDGSAAVYTMGATPQHITTLEHHNSAITSVDFSRNTLALASGDMTVSLWTPVYQ